jgi:hypothetical protein
LERPPWFREVLSVNDQNGQSYRSFDLTRDGFILPVAGRIGAGLRTSWFLEITTPDGYGRP